MFSFLKWWNITFVPHAKRIIILTAYLFVGSLMVETEFVVITWECTLSLYNIQGWQLCTPYKL